MRITQRDLEAVVTRINRITGNKETAWEKSVDGHYKANIGTYHLSGAYGGVSLHQICAEGGGVNDVFRCGHVPKRELYNRMQAFIDGLEAQK